VRDPRLSGPGRPPLIAVAHGSRDPRAAATVGSLLAVARSRAGAPADIRVAFLDHGTPTLPQVLGSLDPGTDHRAVVVPLLLTAAYHSKTDIPAQLALAATAQPDLQVEVGDTLGPHPLLLTALERRLDEAGVPVGRAAERAATSVVLAAAGSTDPAANATVAALAAGWQADRGWQCVVPAYASAAAPTPAQAVTALLRDGARRVVVATYLLAPGYFADKIAATAAEAGAGAVSDVLGAAPEVADVLLARYAAARGRERLWPPPGYPERTVVTPQLVTGSGRGDRPRRSNGACAAPRPARRGRLMHS
jgi:sirohydrochlorin ferrochelatase